MRTGRQGFLVLLFLLGLSANSLAAHKITYWPGNKPAAVSLTFDDGHPSQYSLGIPALNERGFKGTFFLITDLVGMGTDQ